MSDLEETLAEMEELEKEPSEMEKKLCSTIEHLTSSEADQNNALPERAALYKATRTPINQKERRAQLLEEMKQRRNEAVNQKRGLLVELLNNAGDIEALENDEPQPMEVISRRRRRRRRRNYFRNQLMLSEWFTEIPSDLESGWLVKMCPVGMQNLVVAHHGVTKAYNKSGAVKAIFQSALPGGNRLHMHRSTFTVLHCIYSPNQKCFYILDAISWNSFSLAQADAQTRFFWLKSKMEETPELNKITAFNKHLFFGIETFPAELPLIQDKLSRPLMINNEIVPLDGVLFYHRFVYYIEGITPLVGWLKPFMIPEMLHVPVDQCYMSKKPNDYTSLEQYINSRPKSSDKMDLHENDCDCEVKDEEDELDCDIKVCAEVEMET